MCVCHLCVVQSVVYFVNNLRSDSYSRYRYRSRHSRVVRRLRSAAERNNHLRRSGTVLHTREVYLKIHRQKKNMASILCRWSDRLELSRTGHSFGTIIINFQKHAQDTIFFHVPISLTNYCFAAYEQRTLYGALVLAMLLRLKNCRFIIILLLLNTTAIQTNA